MLTKKILVADFSLKNSANTVSSQIAKAIVKELKESGYDSDEFTITPIETYPTDAEIFYAAAKAEKESHARPEIEGRYSGIRDISDIVLVAPNWWNSIPMAVFTFFDHTNANGKRLVPVILHSGDGAEKIETELRNFLSHTDVMPAISVDSNVTLDTEALSGIVKKVNVEISEE